MPEARRPAPPDGVRRLPDDATIVVLSDSHIGGDPGRDIFESPAELAALLAEIAALDGPVELVLAGDFFDFLEIGDVPPAENRASLTVARPEYRDLFAALRRLAAGPGRRVVYLPGNHDAEMWRNPAVRETLRGEGLVHEFVLSYAARFASAPERIVYCEHGNQFDPANAFADVADPLDTPLGEHMVLDVLRRIAPDGGGDGPMRDVNRVYPLVAIPGWLATRLFYDLLTQVVRAVLAPLVVAYGAFRVWAFRFAAARSAAASVLHRRRRRGAGGQRLFVEIAYDVALLLFAFAVFVVVVRRQSGRAVAATATRLPGLDPTHTPDDRIRAHLASDEPWPMHAGLTGRHVAVVVSGHTHAPALVEVARDGGDPAVAVNAGCFLRQLRSVPAHLKAPAVTVPGFVLTHVRIRLDGGDLRAELWERPKPARPRLSVAERLAILGRLPPSPAVGAAPRVVAAAVVPGSSPRPTGRGG